MPIVQPSIINHQHSPSLQNGGSLHKHKNFKELVQILIENLQSQFVEYKYQSAQCPMGQLFHMLVVPPPPPQQLIPIKLHYFFA